LQVPLIAALVFAFLVVAVLLGRALGQRLAERHLTAETRDTIKLSLGLVATMSALLLGLLVSSAKGAYDTQDRQIDALAAKIATLDRVLVLYGPESAAARQELRATVENAVARAWPQQSGASSVLTPDFRSGDDIYYAVQSLDPGDAMQTELKRRAVDLTFELAEGRALLFSSALARVSTPLLMIVVTWLVLILFGFSVLAPRSTAATVALTVAAAAVSGAILLMLEFYQPFDGLIQISSDPVVASISRVPN
jgi:hypothetical protein